MPRFHWSVGAVVGSEPIFASGQGDHSTPELLRISNVDIVFPREGKRAFVGDAKHGHSRGHGHSVAAQHRHDAGGDENTPARIDAKGAQLHAASVDVLNRLGLTAVLIECVDDKVIFAPLRNFSASSAAMQPDPAAVTACL